MKLFFIMTFLLSSVAFAGLTNGEEIVVDGRRAEFDEQIVQDQYPDYDPNVGDPSDWGNTNSNSGGSGQADTSSYGNAGNQAAATSTGPSSVAAGGLANGNQIQDNSASTMIMGVAMGASFLPPCFQPHGAAYCAMAAMSFADALAAHQTGRNANPTVTDLNGAWNPNSGNVGLSGFGNGNGPNSENPWENGEYEDYRMQALRGLQQIEDSGYTVNEDGSVTGPDGNTFTSGSFASAENLQAAGVSADQAKAVMSDLEKASKDAGAAGAKGGIGGKGPKGPSIVAANSSGFSSSTLGEVEEIIEYRGGKKKKKKGRLPASKAADLSTNYNGTPIGIGMANLFLIVHKKYAEKNKAPANFIRKEY